MRLGNRLREFRLARGETLRGLAEATGVDYSHLSRAERGERTITDVDKVRLAEHFGVSVMDLFFQPNVDSETTEVATP